MFRDVRACELYEDRGRPRAVIERHVSVLGRCRLNPDVVETEELDELLVLIVLGD